VWLGWGGGLISACVFQAEPIFEQLEKLNASVDREWSFLSNQEHRPSNYSWYPCFARGQLQNKKTKVVRPPHGGILDS
jgi:hypothetical protein